MSRYAAVNPAYNAYCADCADGSGPYEDEHEAQAWAEAHNDEHHKGKP